MAGEKELAINVRTNDQGMQSFVSRMVSGLKEITRAAIDMQKALNGVAVNPGAPGSPPPPGAQVGSPAVGGGGGVSLGGIAGVASATVMKSVLDNKQALGSLAKMSKDTMGGMAGVIKEAMVKEKVAIQDTTDALKSLNAQWEKNKALKSVLQEQGIRGGPAMEAVLGTEDRLGKKIQKYNEMNQTARDRYERGSRALVDSVELPEEKKGFFKQLGQDVKGVMGGSLGRMATAGVLVSALADGIRSAVPVYMQSQMNGIQQQAKEASYKGAGVATARGDLRYVAALADMSWIRNSVEQDDFLNIAKSKTKQQLGEIAGTLTSPSVLLSPLSAGAKLGTNLANMDTTVKGQNFEYIQAYMQAHPELMAQMETFQSNAGGNLAAMRRMGGRGRMNSLMDFAGSLGMAGAAAPTFDSLMSSIGREAASPMTRDVLRAQAAGMSAAGAHQLALGALGGTGSTLLNGMMSLTRGGRMDITAAERIGGLAAGQMMNGTSDTSGLGLAGAMTGGFSGGVGDIRIANQYAQGLQTMDTFTTGKTDSYQEGRNLVSALQVLGDGSSIYAQRALSHLDTRTMMDIISSNAEVPDRLKSLGITREQVKEYYEKTIGSKISRFVDLGGSDRVTTTMRGIKEGYGGNIGAFLKDPKGLFQTATKQQQEMLMTDIANFEDQSGIAQTFDAGMGDVRLMAGIGGRIKSAKGAGGEDAGAGSDEKKYLSTIANWDKKVRDSIGTMESLGIAIRGAVDMMKEAPAVFQKAGDFNTSAEFAAGSLLALGRAANAVAIKFGGKPVPEPSPAEELREQQKRGSATKAEAK